MDEVCACRIILFPERDLLWKYGSIRQQIFNSTVTYMALFSHVGKLNSARSLRVSGGGGEKPMAWLGPQKPRPGYFASERWSWYFRWMLGRTGEALWLLQHGPQPPGSPDLPH